MDDEPLSQWAERRAERVGQLRAVPFVSGEGPRGAHLNPDAPRAIQRWNGHMWEPYAFAANLAEAQRVLFPDTGTAPSSGPAPKLGPGPGRHRKPRSPR
ncbi:DUF6087 family protein [Streptomyces capillispiralis]|uniref:Uncharacterized protein n=1 Tax=Streptomyces capillispiralis TaxID=68182 RepID=A0A561TL62_9ACTN|nr:DUF6087 family protein [Streptomyces capillispiralis]TWF87896.1 hypothetical protein FHX78_114914 [Streptomyces capillispiralis]GHH95013.1 hypothetical protein GCM10017779_54700 [Streptomyces capillispiralis]